MTTEQNEIKSAEWRKKNLSKNSVLADVSNNEVEVCDHSHGLYFDEKGIITCARCYPPKIKQADC